MPAQPEPGRGDARLEGLSVAQRALLEKRLLERRAASRREQPIPPRQGDGPWPLSYAQELLWLVDQLSPGGNAYNSPDATRLRGPLDVAALTEAVTAVVGRNEVLRTVYEVLDGAPVQRVLPAAPVPLPVTDLSGMPEGAREVALYELLKEESEHPFDLARDLMLRVRLVRLAPEDHVLLFVVHHIAIDGWSKGVLWTELTAFYEAALAGTPPRLDPPALQYADWAVWHRDWLSSGVLDDQLAYWREQLTDAPALLDLPTDRPRPPLLSHRGDHHDTLLPLPALEGLRAVARDESTTLFVVVLAAFGALLHRYTGQDDIVVGTPLAGRNRVELERVVGYFTNTLALRLDFSGRPTFRGLVRQARATTLQAFANQDVPYEKVVSEVNPDRDPSSTPLFQVMLVLQNQKRSVFSPVGLDAEPLRHERGWAKFDLTVGMVERPTGLNTSWEFATDLFDTSTVTRMTGHFATLVASALESPDRPLAELTLSPPSEQAQLAAWNATGPPLPATADGRLLHRLVSDARASRPHAVAVEHGGRSLDYAGLESHANRLAHRLLAAGVARGAPVGIALERSTDLVVALLAVLKAGAVCLPLDLASPPDRLRALLADAGAGLLLSHAALGVPVPDATVMLDVRAEAPHVAALPDSEPATGVGPDDPAYLLYTSGSTGRPKGVLLTHGGLANHACAAGSLYRMTAADRTLQFASIGFDISVEEIFTTLAAGGTVVLRPDDLPLGGAELVDWLTEARISVLDLPTAFWHEWVHDLEVRGLRPPASLRLVVVGGEKAIAAAYTTWRRVAGDRVAWINTYGPTETSVIATAYEPAAGWTPRPGEDIPLGRPVPGVRVHLVDDRGGLVPVGGRGEIAIAGAGVAAGYLGRPELTAERFVPEIGRPGERMYRTGDLGRYRADGTIDYLGRADGQVKLRGYRIEPGEVESVLCSHPRVGEAAVVVRGEGNSAQLVAYAAAGGSAVGTAGAPATDTDSQPVDGATLRRFLSEQLPAYLVPSAVVVLEALPLTANGKVDRAALPEPQLDADGSGAPRDEIEAALHAVWRQVLGSDGFGVGDNFFDVGGHSLLAVRMIALVEREMGHRLPLATVLKAPTIAALAEVLRGDERPASWDCVVPLRPEGSRVPLWCLHLLSGEVIAYRNLIRHVRPDQPLYGLQSVGLDRRSTPLIRIEDMARRYIAEMKTVQPEGPYLLAGLCFGGVVAYEMARQLRRQGDEVALVGLVDARPFGHPRTDAEGNPLPRQRKLDLVRRPGPDASLRARYRMARWLARSTVRWWVVRTLVTLRRPLPERLQDVKRLNRRAGALYRAPACPGDVTVFRAAGGGVDDATDRRLHWRHLVSGRMHVRDVDSPGVHHLTLLKEPHVAAFVVKLEAAIDAALGSRP